MDLQMIKKLTDSFGPPGFENETADIAKEYASNYNVYKDYMQNLFINYSENPDKPVVMLDAHLDEVGFMVQSITSNGLLKIVPLGGWVANNVPAHSFLVKNSDGEIHRAVSTSKPPHFSSRSDPKELDINEDIMLDLGVTCREDVINIFKVSVGDPVVPEVYFDYNEKTKIMFGKAFDNRLGCCCVLEVMKRLADKNLGVHVTGALSSQEEVGTRGAKVAANRIKPALSITFEGTPADDLYFDKYTAQGVLGEGCQIRHRDSGMVSNPQFIKFAKEIGAQNNIKMQFAVRKAGSTNAASIHLANNGCPCLVIGVPSRYAHTHYGYAHMDDLNAAVDLAVKVIEKLNTNSIDKIFGV